MKKILLALTMMVTIGMSAAFAGEGEVSKRVLNAFQSEFNKAQDVSWSTGNNFYKAEFTMNGQRVFAYYSLEGDLLGVARFISPLQLPLRPLTQLKNDYSDYWVSDLFEVNNEDGTQYYVTLEKSDEMKILVSIDGSSWSVYSQKKKV